jgi:hypothetical protein
MAGLLGRMAGAAAGAVFSKQQSADPIKGALIGAATMFVARRLLPARIAGIGATLAAGYVAKKLADRAAAKAEEPAAPKRTKRRRAPARAAATGTPAPAPEPDAAADRTVPPTVRTTKVPQGQRRSETA